MRKRSATDCRTGRGRVVCSEPSVVYCVPTTGKNRGIATVLLLSNANRKCAAGSQAAKDKNIILRVAVCDAVGKLLVFQHMDGAIFISGDVSAGKAVSSVGFGIASGDKPLIQTVSATQDGTVVPVHAPLLSFTMAKPLAQSGRSDHLSGGPLRLLPLTASYKAGRLGFTVSQSQLPHY